MLGAAGRTRWAALVGVALTLGCAGEPPAPPPAAVDELPPSFSPPEAVGRTTAVEARVLQVRFQRAADGTLQVALDLTLEMLRPWQWDGLRTWFRRVVLTADDAELFVGATPLPARGAVSGPGFFVDRFDVPADGARRAHGTLVVALGTEQSPDSLRLVLGGADGEIELPILGGVRDASGARALGVQVLDPQGRPAAGATVTADGVAVPPPPPHHWWRVPPGARALVLEAPGLRPRTVSPPEGRELLSVRLEPSGDDPRARLSRAVPLHDVPAAAWDLEAVADQLATPEDIGAFVRELGVLPATGIQRSPEAVVRLGAGTPLERAETARALLMRRGVTSSLTCGDLPADQHDAVFGELPPVSLDAEPLAGLGKRAVELADALAPALEAQLGGLGRLDDTARARIRLVPEWCWVRVPLGERDYLELDLRPAAVADAPLPEVWRVTREAIEDTWRVTLVFDAMHQRGEEPDVERWQSQLAVYDTTAAYFTHQALLFDLYPDRTSAGPARLRAQTMVVADDEAGGRVNGLADEADLSAIQLTVTWIDPRGVVEGHTRHVLWSRDEGGPPPERLRALVSGDGGARDVAPILARVDAAWHGRHPTPDAVALWARHDLFWTLARAASRGVAPADPTLAVTVLARTGEDVRRSFQQLRAPAPAFVGDPDLPALTARLGAAYAAARRVVDGVEAGEIAAPDRWAFTEQPYEELGRSTVQWQLGRIRMLQESGWIVGAEPVTRSFWALHGGWGGAGFLGLRFEDQRWAPPEPAPEGEVPNDPLGVQRVWVVPTLCAETPLWGDAAAVADLCRPERPAPPP